jgi:hypothetical protein
MRIFICGLLFSSLALAQDVPDFSGTFLRSSVDSQAPAGYAVADPILLEVKQSAESLELTATQNGATANIDYRLDGAAAGNKNLWGVPSSSQARLKGQSLEIESSMEQGTIRLPPAARGLHVKENWTLSPDGLTLTIRRTYEFQNTPSFNFTEKETYARQISLAAVAAKTDAASGASRCNSPSPAVQQLGAGPHAIARTAEQNGKTIPYNDGALLGETVFQQLGRCVEFSADVSSPFFNGLERTGKPDHFEFHKNGSSISNYPDSVVLEVEPVIRQCLPWASALGPFGTSRASVLPQEFLDLRFHLKWTGSETRDLPNLASELLTEPWTELRPPEKFYRLTVPTKGVLLTDTLEIQILSSSGEQIACITGHI